MRIVLMAAGLAGGLACSQVPQFTQAYTLRLAGAVEELALVAAQFDASASAAGLSRDEALADLRGTPFLELRRRDMAGLFGRLDRLRGSLAGLQEAGPLASVLHLSDGDLLRATWADFKPGISLTSEGLTTGAVGTVVTLGAAGALSASIRRPRRQRS